MILEITRNRYTNKNSKDILQEYRMWFIFNTDEWFKSLELEEYCGGNARSYINKLRCEGLSIVSSKKGYKLSTDKEEIKECSIKLRSRALKILTAAKLMKSNI